MTMLEVERSPNHRAQQSVETLGVTSTTLLPNGARRPAEGQWGTHHPERWKGKKVALCVGSFVPRKAHCELVEERFTRERNARDLLATLEGTSA